MSLTESNYTKARLQLERAERDLHRAFVTWSKVRARVRRYERRLDSEFNGRGDEPIGGKLDWRELAKGRRKKR